MNSDTWKEVALGEVCEIIDSLHETPKYSEEGYSMVRVTDIKEGYIKLDNAFKVSKDIYEKFTKKYKPSTNDILMTRVGTYGVCSYVVTDAPFCLGQNTIVIKPRIVPQFVYYILISPQVKAKIEEIVTGSTQKTISLRNIKNLRFRVPSPSKQKSIAAILSCLDDKIELNDNIGAKILEIAQAFFKSWFIDFAPFIDGEFIDSEQGKIPAGWRVGKLEEVIELFDSRRIPLSSRVRKDMKKLYPYYGATSLMDYVDNYLFDGVYVLLGEDGTVVDKKGYPILQYVWGKFWVNNHAHILRGKNGYNEQSIYMLLRNLKIASIVTGAVQQKINQFNLKSLKIIIPPSDIIAQYNAVLDEIFCQKRNIEEQNRRLSQLRDSLLPRIMSGEIIVPSEKKELL